MRQCSKCYKRYGPGETVCPDDGTLLADEVPVEEQAIGLVLDDKYRIDSFLKKGGMGTVYIGTHLLLNKSVALKLIKPELISSPDIVNRFFREARAAARLSHPNIVSVQDLGKTSDGILYIAMELLKGNSLKDLILDEGALKLGRAINLTKIIGGALAHAHQRGVIHRDLKSQNIIVSLDSKGEDIPKLLDFGIAKTLEPDSPALTSTGMVIGTPHYMSVEQIQGLPVDQRSDLYSLGVILYEMLAGKVPFHDTSIPQVLVKHLNEVPRLPTSLSANVSRKLEFAVLRCLEKDPANRYQSAEELISDLEDISGNESSRAGVTVATPVPKAKPLPLVAPSPALDATPGKNNGLHVKQGHRSLFVWGFLFVLLLVIVFFGYQWNVVVREQPSASDLESENALVVSRTSETEEKIAVGQPAVATIEVEKALEKTDFGKTSPSTQTISKDLVPEKSITGSSSKSVPAVSKRAASRVVRDERDLQPVINLPERPAVAVTCKGLRDGCTMLKREMFDALRKRRFPPIQPSLGPDVVLKLTIEEVEVRAERQFETNFVIRTYAIAAIGSSRHFKKTITLSPELISFDIRLGRGKLKERSRVVASNFVDALIVYWSGDNRGK